MRLARSYASEDVRIEEAAEPRPGPGEVVARVRACGICGSDLMPWYVERKAPVVLGHEVVGELLELGPGVEGLRPGQRVFVHHHAPCFVCHHCRRGRHTLCRRFHGTRLDPGGFAERVRVPAAIVQDDLLPLPDEVSDEEATFIEPLACAVRALDRAGFRPGQSALVVGAGLSGLLLLGLLRHWGAGALAAVEPDAARRRTAGRLGAQAAWSPDEDVGQAFARLTGEHGPELTLVATSSPSAVRSGLEWTEAGGTLLLYAPTAPEVRIDVSPHELFFREITLTASYSASPLDTRRALELVRDRALPLAELVTHRFSLEQTAEALRQSAQGGETLKVIVLP